MNEELNNIITIIFLICMNTDSEDLDTSKPELFDALGHPFRVKLITVLTKHPLSFAELKHVMNIKSSGHLSFHLGKLNDLITSTPEGKYQLSEYGHEALHLISTINQFPPRSERRDVVPHSRRTIPSLITIISFILIIILLPLAIYGVNIYFQPKTVQRLVLDKGTTSRLGEDSQYTQWHVVMLRLITKDSVNQYPVGKIHSYLFQGNTYDAIHVGDLITGIPDTTTKDALDLIEITPFVKPPIINTGSIVALIVKFNQTVLPFSLGVSTTSPIPPSQIEQGAAPLRWYDAEFKQIMDFTPVLGVNYHVTLTILFDDDTVVTHTRMVNFTKPIPHVIGLFFDSGMHIDVDADLFKRGIHDGFFSLSLRNVWSNETISHIAILFEDKLLIDTMTNIRTGNYWAGSSTLPYQVWTHLSYNVTIQIRTVNGKGSTLTMVMFPRYLTTK